MWTPRGQTQGQQWSLAWVDLDLSRSSGPGMSFVLKKNQTKLLTYSVQFHVDVCGRRCQECPCPLFHCSSALLYVAGVCWETAVVSCCWKVKKTHLVWILKKELLHFPFCTDNYFTWTSDWTILIFFVVVSKVGGEPLWGCKRFFPFFFFFMCSNSQ